MPPSYQTIPLVTPPKDEPSSTSVPMMKKVAVAAMVGMALVGGNAYGSSNNPAMINIVNGFTTGGPPPPLPMAGNLPPPMPTGLPPPPIPGGMSALRVPKDPACGVGDAPTKCPSGQEFWSLIGGLFDVEHCVSDNEPEETVICAQLCITSNLASFIIEEDAISPAPQSPVLQKGSCADHGHSHATGKNINLQNVAVGSTIFGLVGQFSYQDMISQISQLVYIFTGGTPRVASDPSCGVGDAPKTCPSISQEVWSVSGDFYDAPARCVSEDESDFCAEVCITPFREEADSLSFISFAIDPQKVSCAKRGFLTATGKSFNTTIVTKGKADTADLDFYLFTK